MNQLLQPCPAFMYQAAPWTLSHLSPSSDGYSRHARRSPSNSTPAEQTRIRRHACCNAAAETSQPCGCLPTLHRRSTAVVSSGIAEASRSRRRKRPCTLRCSWTDAQPAAPDDDVNAFQHSGQGAQHAAAAAEARSAEAQQASDTSASAAADSMVVTPPEATAHCQGEPASHGNAAHSSVQQRSRQQQLQRNALAAVKRLWRSQTLSWRRLRREKRLLQVPWGSETIVQVMFFWIIAFCFLGCCVLPVGLDLLGFDPAELSPRVQALAHLALDALQMGSTLAILWLCLRGHRAARTTDGWFPLAWAPAARWLAPTAVACAFFPAITALSAVSQSMFPATGTHWNTELLEQSLGSGDLVTNAMYFVIVGVCAPVWEEAIFRGFLLPSLGRWLPLPAAIALSAFIFAIAHLPGYQFAPLLALGLLLGLLFVHTRNLAAPMLLHSVWNMYIFFDTIRSAAVGI